MKHIVPDEVIDLYGIIATSKILTARTEATYAQLPAVAEIIEKARSSRGQKRYSLSDFDVENAGDEDAIQDWLYEGFLGPDDLGGIKKPPAEIIEIPPELIRERVCGQLRAAYWSAWFAFRGHAENAERLERLVSKLKKNAHPLVQIFAALFKAALQDAQEKMQQLGAEMEALRDQARSADCPPLDSLQPRR